MITFRLQLQEAACAVSGKTRFEPCLIQQTVSFRHKRLAVSFFLLTTFTNSSNKAPLNNILMTRKASRRYAFRKQWEQRKVL